ncbi:MAG: DUF4317 domain-containing protein [Suipraeoptans sp.]
MNKKDVLEIRKQFTPERCAITAISGCYVTHEKEKKLEFKRSFLTLEEEEMFKYFDIFKKSLSGNLGKNLFNMDYSLADEDDATPHHLLMKVRDSKLEDEDIVSEFYDRIVESYEYPENYYITLIHGVYDVPGKSLDGSEMFDSSDNVYDHILCCICPVNLAKAGLSYNSTANTIENRVRDWVVDMPMTGFLFPAFNDRNADIHSILYYSKLVDDLKPDFISNALGGPTPLTAKDQKYAFDAVVSDTLEDECDFDTVKTIHENILEMMEEVKDEPEPLTFSKTDVKKLLEKSGVDNTKLDDFDSEFNDTVGDEKELMATNIANSRTFEIKSPDVVVKVNPARTDLVDIREIDGRKCLVIAVDDSLMVNGIDINK